MLGQFECMPSTWPGAHVGHGCLAAGAFEFTAYLPTNMQSVLVQPVGNEGVLVLGSDYQRGFGRVDQVGTCIFVHAQMHEYAHPYTFRAGWSIGQLICLC